MLNEIINGLPIRKSTPAAAANDRITASGSLNSVTASTKRRAPVVTEQLDPKKRYMACTIVRGMAFADYVNLRNDEHMSVTASFLKSRFHTKMVQCSTDPVFEETFMFEFEGENPNIKFDAAMLLKLAQPIHITVLRHRKNEKPVVLGTKAIEWRPLLYCN